MPTKIEWAQEVWNPIRGCSRVSSGCQNCYAERVAARFSGEIVARDSEGQFTKELPYHGLATMSKSGPRWTGDVRLIREKIDLPCHWAKPRRIFVNSMSDIFHHNVIIEWQDSIFAVMNGNPRHTFLILTKRPQAMMDYMQSRYSFPRTRMGINPPGNVWLGVSVEDRTTFQDRVSMLKATPASFRWVSVEPLIADLGKELDLTGINFLVCGAETGPHKRPCRKEWIDSLRDQCASYGVPFFGKVGSDGAPITPREMPEGFTEKSGKGA